MRGRIRALIWKELLQVRRDRRMLAPLIIAPLFQLFVFGYAVTLDVKHVGLVVCDRDRTADSRALVQSLPRSGYFDLQAWASSSDEFDRALLSGQALMALDIPSEFSKRLARGEPARVQVIIDGTDMNAAGVAAGYASALLSQFHRSQLPAWEARPPVENHPRVFYNPDLRSLDYMVPGVICMILGTTMTAMTAMGIVRERETGTLEQLIVTPVRPMELMLGKMLPFAAIGMLDVVLIMLAARFWFGVHLAGSAALLLLLSVLFLLTTLGLGLFISTISRTQQQAMLTAFFVITPSVILSGFMFPIENMPRWVQWLAYGIPLRYFVEIVRGIFLRGVGVAVLWPQVTALLGLGGAIFSLSAARFRKRLG